MSNSALHYKSAMDSFKIVIVEDDFQFVLKVEMLLDEMGLKLEKSFDNAEEALPYIRSNPPDLVLLDIFLKGEMTGIELANQVNDLEISFIIFSADSDEELYDRVKQVNLISYIIKPFNNLTLKSAIEIALRKMGHHQDDIETLADSNSETVFRYSFFIRKNKQLIKISINDIKWVYSEGNYCFIVTVNRKHVIKASLSKLVRRLPANKFVRVHRSYLVMVSRIDNVDYANNHLLIEEAEIPIGRTYKAELVKRLDLFG
jgi:Response regulator of the LytR/AlgR family